MIPINNLDILYNSKKFIQLNNCLYPTIDNYFKSKKGFIYIAISKDNSFIKIGRTKKNPLERAKTLSSTGVFNEYEIVYSLEVLNQFFCESYCHKLLKQYRVKKEFFLVNLDVAINTLNKSSLYEDKVLSRYFNVQLLKKNIPINDCIR